MNYQDHVSLMLALVSIAGWGAGLYFARKERKASARHSDRRLKSSPA